MVERDAVSTLEIFQEKEKTNRGNRVHMVIRSLTFRVLQHTSLRRHSSKFQANCALFDTSMKFGTYALRAVTSTSIFRYSAKLDVHWFPWKPQYIKIHEIPLFTRVYQQILSFQWFQLVYQIRFVLVYGTLPLTTCCHGNEKSKSHV